MTINQKVEVMERGGERMSKLFIVSMTILPGAPGRRVAFDMWGIPLKWRVSKGITYAELLTKSRELPIHPDYFKDYSVEEYGGTYNDALRRYLAMIEGEIAYIRTQAAIGRKNILDGIAFSISVNRHISWFRQFFPEHFRIEDFDELVWNKLVRLGRELPKVKLRLDLIGHWRDIGR
jgi:hypothetical protein